MQITDKRVELKYKFDELDIGDVFIYNGDVYMKIDPIYNASFIVKNAVNLHVGCLCEIDKNETVLEVDAELIIT